MEIEQIQELLNDAMEMAQDAELLPPHISAEDIDTIAAVLTDWIIQLQTDDEGVDLTTSRQIIASAISCAYIAGRLNDVQVNDHTNPTHRSINGNNYYIYNYFG